MAEGLSGNRYLPDVEGIPLARIYALLKSALMMDSERDVKEEPAASSCEYRRVAGRLSVDSNTALVSCHNQDNV